MSLQVIEPLDIRIAEEAHERLAVNFKRMGKAVTTEVVLPNYCKIWTAGENVERRFLIFIAKSATRVKAWEAIENY